MIEEVSPTYRKGCPTFIPLSLMKFSGKKGFILVSGYSLCLWESQGKDLENENKTKLVNLTSKSRERIRIYIPATWPTSSILYNSRFKLSATNSDKSSPLS